MRTLGIIFYTVVSVLIGLFMIISAFVLSIPTWQDEAAQLISDFVYVLQETVNYRVALGLSGVLLIFISFSFAQLILARFQREKTIAFHTPSGEVTIALSAIEDLIKHFSFMIPQIKEVKPDVIATRKGSLLVNLRVILKSEANIPELTAQLQEMTKSKIQEVLGLEEEIIIRIHIAKILSHEEKDKRKKDNETEPRHFSIPGYGRV
ncbi:MAG: alkaline shock response membrane anchor protein AmaP [Candidatus Omnitrophica bacterium]|nr:alkaline shock response membrane anchor protein AmaP [Candidatus Omnitrophota bacterium]